MGRPKKGTLSSFSSVVIDRVVELRQNYPGWGSGTIYNELKQENHLAQFKLPKPSTIARFLKEKGLTKCYEKHVEMPRSQLYTATSPHYLWQIDGQGALEVEGLGRINLINTKDIYSRIYCGCLPAKARSHNGSPSSSEYQYALRFAFTEFGLPKKKQTDHAAVFFENKGKSPFPTRFHLWLVSLGIDLVYSRKFRPTDQAIVERSHQTMSKQALQGQSYNNLQDLLGWCDQRRKQLNEEIPSISTHRLAPLKAYPKARYTGRFYRPEVEHQLINFDRVYEFLAQGKWFRKVNKNKTLYLGGQWYYLQNAQPSSRVSINFDPDQTQLIFRNVNELIVGQQNIKNLTLEYLMGESFLKMYTQNFQLEIPLIWENIPI